MDEAATGARIDPRMPDAGNRRPADWSLIDRFRKRSS